jgi:hypothetical protein
MPRAPTWSFAIGISSTQSWNVISKQRTCSPEGVRRVHVWSTHVCYYARECSVSSCKRWNVSLGVVTSREASWLGTRLTCLTIITSSTVLSTHTDPVPRFWGDVRALRVDESSLVPSQVSHAKGSGSHFSPKGGIMCDGRFAERPINWIDSRISSYMGW